MAAGTFFVTMDPHELVGVDPDASGKLTIRFQGGATHATVAGDLVALDEFSRRDPYAVSVSAGYTVELPTDVASGGDPEDSAVGYDLTWFNGDATVRALFVGQPDGSTVMLSDLAPQENIPVAASEGYALQAENSAAAAAASAAAAATFDPANFVGKHTLVFNVADYADDIQAAIDAAETAGGGTVWFPPGETFVITDTLNIAGNHIRLIGNGATIDATGMPDEATLSGQIAIDALGTVGSNVSVTANVARYATTVTVTSTASFAAGDLVLLTSDQNYTDGATGTYGNRGALHRVASITDSTHLELTEPSFFAYASASSAVIRKVNPLEGFYMENLTLLGGRAEGSDHCGIRVEYAVDPVLSHITALRFSDTAIQYGTVWGGLIEAPICRDGESTIGAGQTGYGVAILDASRHVTIRDGQFANSRHAITGGGSPVSIHITCVNNTASGMLAAAFDCHEECWWWVFDNNTAVGGDDSGFGIRGQSTTLRNNRSYNAGSHGFHIKSYDVNTDGLLGPTLIGNEAYNPAGCGLYLEGTADCRIKGGLAEGNLFRDAAQNHVMVARTDDFAFVNNIYDTTAAWVSGGDQNNIRLLGTSSSDRCTNITVRGGTFKGATRRWLRADFTDKLNIIDPSVTDAGSQTDFLVSCTLVRVQGVNGSGGEAETDIVGADANRTLTPLVSPRVFIHNGTLTAARTLTLSTTNAYDGARFRVVRVGGGAFNLNVGTGPLKGLATGQWADFLYDEALAWRLVAFGSL